MATIGCAVALQLRVSRWADVGNQALIRARPPGTGVRRRCATGIFFRDGDGPSLSVRGRIIIVNVKGRGPDSTRKKK